MKWIPLVLLLTAALAGCSDDGGAEPDPTDSSSSTTGTTTPATTTSQTTSTTGTSDPTTNQTQENRPPTANLTADLTEGEAPLQVQFRFNATDLDGDELSWTIDVDGDGEADGSGNSVPSEYSHTFDEAGTYNVVASVSDGEAFVNATVTITVLQATAPEPAGPTQEFNGSFMTGTPVECQYGFLGNLDGITYIGTTAEPASIGLPYTATFTTLAPSAFFGISWFDDGGSWLGDHTGEPAETSISGTVPAGASNIYFWSCAGSLEVDVHYLVA